MNPEDCKHVKLQRSNFFKVMNRIVNVGFAYFSEVSRVNFVPRFSPADFCSAIYLTMSEGTDKHLAAYFRVHEHFAQCTNGSV